MGRVPTILRFGAFRIMIYTDDHEPAHVHVLGRGGQAIFVLNCSAKDVSVRARRKITLRDERRIAAFLMENLGILCEAWERLHD